MNKNSMSHASTKQMSSKEEHLSASSITRRLMEKAVNRFLAKAKMINHIPPTILVASGLMCPTSFVSQGFLNLEASLRMVAFRSGLLFCEEDQVRFVELLRALKELLRAVPLEFDHDMTVKPIDVEIWLVWMQADLCLELAGQQGGPLGLSCNMGDFDGTVE